MRTMNIHTQREVLEARGVIKPIVKHKLTRSEQKLLIYLFNQQKLNERHTK